MTGNGRPDRQRRELRLASVDESMGNVARDMMNAAGKDLLQPANTGHILQQQ